MASSPSRKRPWRHGPSAAPAAHPSRVLLYSFFFCVAHHVPYVGTVVFWLNMVVSIKARSLPSCWTSVGGRLAGYIHGGGAAGPMASRRARSRPWKKDMVCPTAVLPKIPHSNSCKRVPNRPLQPFSQKSRTPTVAKECQVGLYDPAEGDLELFCDSWSAGFLGERLYDPAEADLEHCWDSCSAGFFRKLLYRGCVD